MTSEVDGMKTNEFLRRRKLRLQQVREQSKDIAKKIRQRAKVEKLRQVVELDARKQSEYLQRQEQLVKQLEHYYSKGIKSVGVSHKNASEITVEDNSSQKVDLSKQRGKEAAAELRNKRQKILDEQKKKLDRKLQARETANEISREKSVNKVLSVPTQSEDKTPAPCKDGNTKADENKNIVANDMATQWDLEEIPEWEPNIPSLALPKDDNNSVKETNNNIVDSKSDKSKRLDLFALSDEMPSSLRGGNTNQEERVFEKTSLTLVSEYLRNRGLRLREPDTTHIAQKKSEDLQSLRQTILRTRASTEAKQLACHNNEVKSTTQNSAVPRKPSLTVYNHSTRDTRDIPCNDQRLVVRDIQDNDDAYSQAMKENTSDQNEKTATKRVQEIRSKVAMTKQNVEKEYQDTISFLNALPKDKGSKPIRTAYMDEERQQMQRNSRQQKMQQEYRKIEKECSKRGCKNKTNSKSRSTSYSNGDMFDDSDMQYSWMPVPDGDDDLAVHTIPTSLKEGRSGNTVKFSKVDSYHEYRSRHKHTPPTKDTVQDKYSKSTTIQNSSDSESVSSDSAQNIRLETREKSPTNTEKLSDAERIIIYKILDSKADKNIKKSKLMKDIAKSLSMIEKHNSVHRDESQGVAESPKKAVNVENRMSFEQLNEGIYKAVTEDGDNISSMYFDEKGMNVDASNVSRRSCPRCQKKSLTKAPREAGTATVQWETADIPTTSRTPLRKNARICDCGHNINTTLQRTEHHDLPSTATSTTSFKTTADKSNNAVRDGGFIKLINDGGQEAGKFYIGASGLLKDDAYEVVIQLRKKGDEKENRECHENAQINDAKGDNKNNVTINETPVTPIEASCREKSTIVSEVVTNKKETQVDNNIQNTSTIKHTVSTETVPDMKNNNTGHTAVNVISNIIETTCSKETVPNIESNDVIVNKPTEAESAKFSDKGVSTSFQDTFAITSHFPKSTIHRPATSTYTQTSLSSPTHRPVFFHMSSSTSTAYMSPPEMILPPFLRPGYQITDEDIHDPRNYDMDKVELAEQHDYSEEYDCRCRKCTHARRKISNVHSSVHHHQTRKQNARTPPNTARSVQNRNGEDISSSKDIKKTKCKCRRCDGCKNVGDAHSSRGHKRSRHLMSAKHSSRNILMHVTSSGRSSNKDSRQFSKKGSNTKSNLKPTIKNYVDKLLILNRESLKAVQVIDQECSTVTTPGSSIIEVPGNIVNSKLEVGTMLSLHEIGNMFKHRYDEMKQNYNGRSKNNSIHQNGSVECLKKQFSKKSIKHLKLPRKKTGQKLKSLNISKNMYKGKNIDLIRSDSDISKSLSSKAEYIRDQEISRPCQKKKRSKSSPTPRTITNPVNISDKSANSDISYAYKNLNSRASNTGYSKSNKDKQKIVTEPSYPKGSLNVQSNRNTSTSPDFEKKCKNVEIPTSMSTQTSLNADSDINYIKLAEDKLHNMEKIADLTEKCTQRLSDLAKVLEEVRKNKSLVYNQISSSDTTSSESDAKIDKNTNKIPQSPHEKSAVDKTLTADPKINNTIDSTDNVPFLSDIPKPIEFKNGNSDMGFNSSSSSSKKSSSPTPDNINYEQLMKGRGKPPPALSRINLKHVQDYLVPHELSTVVEVDSPMSVRQKSSRNDTKVPDISNRENNEIGFNLESSLSSLPEVNGANSNGVLLSSKVDIITQNPKNSTKESSENAKIQMIDMNQFNEIMLKPFFSIQEYAKHCNIGVLEEGSNIDDNMKEDNNNDEFSSLHSDGSLPDVISELLKRNIISEPFKFDTGSNPNSTTISSESTISVLALSRARQGKKKSNVIFQNKENVGETSDTLSISSNPDLEKAFKKLGMGWASSTLKKTKERLALSSSSNTSSSSLSQFKVRSFNPDIPAIVTDTVSSVLNSTNKPTQPNAPNRSKNTEQQTSLTNSMTVKEFLANELAKKITFNKSGNDTEEEFMSLFETKMPEEMKNCSRVIREEDSIENSVRSGNNNRARTSTPVQLFKSMTYHSSSSSNISNSLFSNADDLSSVKVTSNSMKHSTSDKDDLIIPNFSLRMKRGSSECSKSD